MTEPRALAACVLPEGLSPARERDFDDLTSLAAQLCDAAISLVTLVDGDRLHFKAHHGLDADGTDRDGTFCAWVVVHEQPLLVGDASTDARFARGAVVTDAPFVRSYAGVPLVVGDAVVGTLCVMDPRPHHLGPVQLDQLHILGRQTVGQLLLRQQAAELRREVAVRERAERRIRALFEHSPIGLAECALDGTFVEVNDTLCRMLQLDRSQLVGRPSSDLLPGGDEREEQRADLRSLDARDSYFARRRYRRGDGTLLPVHVGVARVPGGEGPDALEDRVLATVTDIADQISAEERLHAAHDELRRRQIFTDAVLDSIDVGIVACDEEGRLTVFNRATQAWHGLGAEAEEGRDPANFATSYALYDYDGTTVLTPDRVPLLRALTEGAVERAEIVIAPEGRAATRVECTGRSMVDEDGHLLGAVVAMNDITAVRAQQAALLASETRSRAIFDNDPAALVLLTVDGRVVQANAAVASVLGLSEAQQARVRGVEDLLLPDDRAALDDLVTEALLSGGRPVAAEARLATRDGRSVWCLLTVTDLPDPELGHCLLLQAEDVTLRKEAEQRLTHQALYDGLTDLPNRTLLSERIRTAMARVRRRGEGAVWALFCDLDGFKAVNDTFGHDAGDHLLTEIGRRLAATVRAGDTVGRLGGDEFLVVCEDVATAEEVAGLAERVAQAVATPVLWQGAQLRVSVSIGIARADGASSPDQLVRRADAAMYRAKRRGKAGYAVDEQDEHRSASVA